ncbi:MAG: trigger factor [Lachnospiraceae bacterium]|nr:trigger factor [Lachnospiraceae bacterium]MDE7059228.1 trigger factor [Lachnospiraceae bacterium]
MSVQVEKQEKNMAKLTIEVSAEKVEKAIQSAYQKERKHINIPGFRKGKAPRQLIEKMYGKEVFYNEALDNLLPTAYAEALEECEEEVVSRPKISIEQMESGKALIFTASVALKPEAILGEYKGVQVEKPVIEVLDAEIEAEITKEREANARTITVDDRAVMDGDMIILDYAGSVDGVPFEGGTATNQELTIGSKRFIPGFEEQLIGAAIDEEREIQVTFPEEYHAKDLAGKEAVFKCLIHEIKVKELPEVDDEFAQEVSEFDTLDAYKEDIKEKLFKDKEAEAKRAKEDAVIQKIIEGASMEIPDAMIDFQTEQMLEEFGQRIQMQGMSIEQYFQITGMTEENYKEQVKPRAKQNIESRLVLEAVAKAENLEATDEDLEAEMVRMADMYKMELDKVKEMMGDFQKDEIKKDIVLQKAIDLVTQAAVEA